VLHHHGFSEETAYRLKLALVVLQGVGEAKGE
jgi:hypothetical protein